MSEQSLRRGSVAQRPTGQGLPSVSGNGCLNWLLLPAELTQADYQALYIECFASVTEWSAGQKLLAGRVRMGACE